MRLCPCDPRGRLHHGAQRRGTKRRGQSGTHEWSRGPASSTTSPAESGSSEALVSLADEGIDELAKGGGTKEKAGAEGAQGQAGGKNPFRAAIAGAWSAGTPVVRAAIVAAVVAVIVLLVASPVLLIVFLLSLLIIAAVQTRPIGEQLTSASRSETRRAPPLR